MPLTPEDVSNKRFTTVRLREGYDMTEVDQFLDEVESELARLLRENAELRGRPSAEGGEQPAADALETSPEAVAAPTPADAHDTGAEPSGRTIETETLRVSTTAEASAAATRLLEMAGRNADELVAEARQEANQIVGDARSTAASLEAEARDRASSLDTETTQRRHAVFGDIDQQKQRLDAEVERLREFEREYRSELRTYFEEQLAALDGQGVGGVLGHSEPGAADSPGLQELLTDPNAEDPAEPAEPAEPNAEAGEPGSERSD